jgi:maltose alpha-D-glucosyltransferase / alpha-amylase
MNDDNRWYQQAVFYEMYIRAFQDSSGDGNGDFRGAIQRLDYIRSLGVDCIWILPMYPSPLHDDGYDVADYYDIHPDYGTLEDFKAFLDAAHERGLRVVTDLVLNHTSDEHPWFQAARRDPESPYHDYYVWSETGTEYPDARIIFLDYEESNWTYDELAGKYYWHRFYSSQPDLNFDNPAVHEEMFNIIRFWLDMGIDGFRADAVPYLYEREGTNCENLPETHAYLKRLRALVDAYAPGTLLLSEANQWPEEVRDYLGDGDEMHMNFHFPLMPRIFMALAKGDRSSIEWILSRTPDIPEICQWGSFLRNHDELTLEMVTPEERHFMWDFYAPDPRMRLNLGIRRRLAPLLENDPARIKCANSILLTLVGSPVLYYGDEIGMGDNIWLDDRNGVRTPMQWNDRPSAGFSTAEETYLPVIADGPYSYEKVNVAAANEDPDSYLWATRFLLQARRQSPALQQGEMSWFEVDSKAILAYWRVLDEHRVLCLFNLDQQRQNISIDLSAYAGRSLVDLLAETEDLVVNRWPLVLNLEPFSSHWLQIG